MSIRPWGHRPVPGTHVRDARIPTAVHVWGRPAVTGLEFGTDCLVPVLPARCQLPNRDVMAVEVDRVEEKGECRSKATMCDDGNVRM